MLLEVVTVCDVLKGRVGIFILLQFGFILPTVCFMLFEKVRIIRVALFVVLIEHELFDSMNFCLLSS